MRCTGLGRGEALAHCNSSKLGEAERRERPCNKNYGKERIITALQVHKIIRERFVALLAVLSAQCRLQNKRCNTAHEP